MKKHRLSGKFTAGLVSLLLAVCLAGSAMSCSLFYFGGDWTDDGANLFLRDEDQDGADENKVYLVTPAGKHRAGETYRGCQKEQWYVEVLTGHRFLAVLLPRSVAFFEANVSVLGLLDLDDTEHIIASDDLNGLAQQAGTFVGNAAENIIDYRLSYNDYHAGAFEILWQWNVAARMAVVLNELEGTDQWKPENVLDNNDCVMTNIAEDGSIVPLYNGLKLKEPVSVSSLISLLRHFPLAYWENEETHLYRFYLDEETALGTVEWSAMGNNFHNVFIPGYPMLMTDTWSGYQMGLESVEVVTEKPDHADYYEMKGVHYMINELKDRSGEYHVYPKEWDTSYRATFIALANALDFGQAEEEQAERADRFGKGPRKAGEDHDGGAHADVGGGAQPGACIVPASWFTGNPSREPGWTDAGKSVKQTETKKEVIHEETHSTV